MSLDAAKSFDVFISHASEDKERFVRHLATLLRELGASVWYDEFSLNLGDSLSDSINRGLLNSRHGLVVLSPAFMAKNWPQHELRGLTVRQVSERNVIIPIWLGVSDKEVREFNLMLADLLAVSADTADPIDISLRILKAVRPDLYESQSRDELAVRLSKSSVDQLRQETALRLKDSIVRRLPSSGQGLITGETMRGVFMDVIDYVSTMTGFGSRSKDY